MQFLSCYHTLIIFFLIPSIDGLKFPVFAAQNHSFLISFQQNFVYSYQAYGKVCLTDVRFYLRNTFEYLAFFLCHIFSDAWRTPSSVKTAGIQATGGRGSIFFHWPVLEVIYFSIAAKGSVAETASRRRAVQRGRNIFLGMSFVRVIPGENCCPHSGAAVLRASAGRLSTPYRASRNWCC